MLLLTAPDCLLYIINGPYYRKLRGTCNNVTRVVLLVVDVLLSEHYVSLTYYKNGVYGVMLAAFITRC